MDQFLNVVTTNGVESIRLQIPGYAGDSYFLDTNPILSQYYESLVPEHEDEFFKKLKHQITYFRQQTLKARRYRILEILQDLISHHEKIFIGVECNRDVEFSHDDNEILKDSAKVARYLKGPKYHSTIISRRVVVSNPTPHNQDYILKYLWFSHPLKKVRLKSLLRLQVHGDHKRAHKDRFYSALLFVVPVNDTYLAVITTTSTFRLFILGPLPIITELKARYKECIVEKD
jgi:hypothetical protein